MILQILFSLASIVLIQGYPTDQYYYNHNNHRNIVPERQILYELPTQTYYYQPRDGLSRPVNGISRPVYYPQLGMSPQYHNLVYNYITDYAGNQKPAQFPVRVGLNEFQPGVQGVAQKVEEFDTDVPKPANEEEKGPVEPETDHTNGNKEEVTEGPVKPGLNEHFLPSDFLLLSHDPQSQFFGNYDAIKVKKMKFQANPTTLPPLGGVVSNYILLRDHPDYQNMFPFARNMPNPNNLQQLNKRQTFYDSYDEGIIVNAENSQNLKKSEPNKQEQNEDKEDDKEEEQPAVAQSKPSAIALAGPGGVAQASPVGTALVGPGGLAVSAPSGTAVAGPAGQAGVAIANPDEKVKAVENKSKEENKKTSDPYY